MAFNNFLEGVATQLINTGLRKVAGNLPGLSQSTGYGGSSTFDQLPLSPRGNVQNYTFPLDVMADPGLGNQGHYMMFYINEQQNARMKFGTQKSNSLPKYASPAQNNLDQPISYNLGGDFSPGRAIAQYGSISARNKALQSVGVKRAPTRRLTTAISMYMPATVATGYSTQYTDTEIGIGAAALLDSGAFDKISSGNFGEGLSAIAAFAPDMAASINAKALSAAGIIPGFQGVRELAEMRSGVILAERMELAFKGIDKRTFQYEFKMSPKSEDEAKEIRNIINIILIV